MNERPPIAVGQPWRLRWFPNHEWILILVLLAEAAVFGCIGQNFLTIGNGFELVRLAVEIGLLALAMTPVIVTGGIDLSVGSLLALCAVTLGWLVSERGWPPAAAYLVVLALGAAGGGLNAALIARLGVPPLIVTLGTFSLYRGLAEGLTGGIANYSHFPPGLLNLGQGYFVGGVPQQLPILALAAIAMYALLQRTAFGRGLYAIGYSAEGARFAGVPVRRRLAQVYVMSGLLAGLAAIVYVARLGQAKADAGTNYELMAITAVVLGGTSIYGGRGTVLGTMLGLFAIVVLENGLRLAALPAELAPVLTGLLLLGAIAGHRSAGVRRVAAASLSREEFEMKNSQVAALSCAMLLSALIIGVPLYRLGGSAPTPAVAPAPVKGAKSVAELPVPVPAKRLTIAMMPKNKGDAYFVSCRAGAEEAAKELGVDLLWDGPTETDPQKQNEVVEAWITKGVDVIAVSVDNQAGISTVLRKARAKGIKVLTWDADSEKDARDFLVNQATLEGIGTTLMDEAGRIMGGKGTFAIITASLTAANQNEWIKYIKARQKAKFPNLKLAVIEPCDDQRDKAFSKAKDILKAYRDVKLIMAIAAPAVPGAAEAVQESGRRDVKVMGLSLPSLCKSFMHSGEIDCIVLWKTGDLGYLTVQAAKALAEGALKPGVTTISAGRLGNIEVKGDEVLLGKPFVFTKANVDQFDF
jgi:rhamnose transport system permease protein